MSFVSTLLKGLLFIMFPVFQPFDSAATPDAQAAFARLQSLKGTWQSTLADGSKSTVQYEVVAGNSAVVERFVNDKMGADNAMVTVYYLDGGRLLCSTTAWPRTSRA